MLDRMAEATIVIKAAAVADYRPVNVSEQKLKRTGPLTLELAPTEDILAEVVRRRQPGQLIVGFAAETENRMENGRAKLLRKGADAIVVNDVAGDSVGIDSDRNAATFLTRRTAIEMPEMSKRKLADRILDEMLALRRPRPLMVEMERRVAAGRGSAASRCRPPRRAGSDHGVDAPCRTRSAIQRSPRCAPALLSRSRPERFLSPAGRSDAVA